jgi:hypothetical protein
MTTFKSAEELLTKPFAVGDWIQEPGSSAHTEITNLVTTSEGVKTATISGAILASGEKQGAGGDIVMYNGKMVPTAFGDPISYLRHNDPTFPGYIIPPEQKASVPIKPGELIVAATGQPYMPPTPTLTPVTAPQTLGAVGGTSATPAITAEQYQMTQEELSGGAAGQVAYTARIAALRAGQSTTGGTGPGGAYQEGDVKTNAQGVKEMFDPTGTWVPLTAGMQPSGQEKVAGWQTAIPPEAIDTKTGLVDTTEGPQSLKNITTPEGEMKPEWVDKIVPPILPTPGESKVAVTSEEPRKKTAQEIINEAKATAETAKKSADELATLTTQSQIAALKKELGLDTGIPAKPTLVSDYEALRSSKGITGLEEQITALNASIADAEASIRQGMYNQEGKLMPMELIGTRQRELARQGQELLDTLNRRKQTMVDELTTKTNLVNNIMTLKGTDYANAVNEYNTKFTQAIQLQDMLSTEEQRKTAQENVVADNARANTTVMMNLMKDSGLSLPNMDESFQVSFTKELMKAGVSVDAISAFLEAEPTLKVDATTTGYDADGNQVISFFSYNNGDPKLIKTIGTGASKESSAADVKSTDWTAAESFIDQNPKASYADLKAGIMQNTKLSNEEINTILASKNIVEKETPMTEDYMVNVLKAYLNSYGSTDTIKQVQSGKLTLDKDGKPTDIMLSSSQITKMKQLLSSNPTLLNIIRNPGKVGQVLKF